MDNLSAPSNRKLAGEDDPKGEDLKHYQTMFRMFLKSFRSDKGWTQKELAEKLNCSKPTVEKLEHSSRPSPPASALSILKPFADLRGISIATLVDVIEGKTNEVGDHDRLLEDIVSKVEQLDYQNQYELMELLSSKCFVTLLGIFVAIKDKFNDREIKAIEYLCRLPEKTRNLFIQLIEQYKGR